MRLWYLKQRRDFYNGCTINKVSQTKQQRDQTEQDLQVRTSCNQTAQDMSTDNAKIGEDDSKKYVPGSCELRYVSII